MSIIARRCKHAKGALVSTAAETQRSWLVSESALSWLSGWVGAPCPRATLVAAANFSFWLPSFRDCRKHPPFAEEAFRM
jgi:hypothetical protein